MFLPPLLIIRGGGHHLYWGITQYPNSLDCAWRVDVYCTYGTQYKIKGLMKLG